MNTFANALNDTNKMILTENGGLAYTTTGRAVYDMFALGAAYRQRSNEDCMLLFKKAFDDDPLYALRCLFWIRDCRGGAGERRFFRVVYKYLAEKYPKIAKANLFNVAEFGRWDDLFVLFGTPIEDDMVKFVREQLLLDSACQTPSLLAKWMPSANTSSKQTRQLANMFIKAFRISPKEYRQLLTANRKKINIVETLMSQNRWDEIQFDKIPSKAGLKYRNAFARRDIIAKKYEAFIKNEDTKVNTRTLYPYEIVSQAVKRKGCFGYQFEYIPELERQTLEKYWNALPDYFDGKSANMMCVVDTSGSMCGKEAAAPINIAIALGMYCAERLNGPLKDHFISFSRQAHYIPVEGADFVDTVRRIYKRNLCENTNLESVFDLLYETAMRDDVNVEDIPETIVVISDMEIDYSAATGRYGHGREQTKTMMEKQRTRWATAGLKLPKLVYWNVQSRNQNKFLDDGPDITYVSGASQVLFEAILKGKTGISMMYDILNKERYTQIKLPN